MKPDKTSDDKQTKNRMAAIVTVMVVIWLILFVIFLAILLWGSNNAMQEVQWARYVYLLTSVETIAFAATGWLFGKEVHREQAMDAKQQASSAMEQATQARKETMGVVDGAMTAMHEAMEQTAQARKEAMDMASKMMDAMQQSTEGKPQAMNTTQNAAPTAGRYAPDEQGQELATRMQNHYRNLEHLKQVLTNKLPDRTVQGEVEKIMKEMEELTYLAIALYPPAH